jgi:hypothetical protein
MSFTKTTHHTIHHTTENVGPFGLFDSADKTVVHDRGTGATGTGLGHTRSEATERAWENLRSENEARKK